MFVEYEPMGRGWVSERMFENTIVPISGGIKSRACLPSAIDGC